jgi:hypothetical protein
MPRLLRPCPDCAPRRHRHSGWRTLMAPIDPDNPLDACALCAGLGWVPVDLTTLTAEEAAEDARAQR